MDSADISPIVGSEGSNAVGGDEGEQLIANVLLAAMISQFRSETAAREYIDYACALAKDLARRSVTYRPLQPSRFARLSFEVGGEINTFLVSVINDALVVPTFSSEKLRVSLPQTRRPIRLVGIELVRFMLRLRTRRIVTALEAVRTEMSQVALLQTVEYLLTECLRQESRPAEPLDRASDCFTVAHDLVGKGNYPLAALLLNNAAGALDSYLEATQVRGHRAAVYSMKGEIGRLLKKITQAAA